MGILFANRLITLPFVDGISPRFVLLCDKNVEDIEDGISENVLSINECPSEEPLLIIAERSFSDIVRLINDDCWDIIAGSTEVDGDDSRGMFEFDKPDPGPEYNDDGIVVIVVDDGVLSWDILLRICCGNVPLKININKNISNRRENITT